MTKNKPEFVMDYLPDKYEFFADPYAIEDAATVDQLLDHIFWVQMECLDEDLRVFPTGHGRITFGVYRKETSVEKKQRLREERRAAKEIETTDRKVLNNLLKKYGIPKGFK